jgi:cell division FtsZ-interacting protein ZapD
MATAQRDTIVSCLRHRIELQPQGASCCQTTAETVAMSKENPGWSMRRQARIAKTRASFATVAEARAMWLTSVAQQSTWSSSTSRAGRRKRPTRNATDVEPWAISLANVARQNTSLISIRIVVQHTSEFLFFFEIQYKHIYSYIYDHSPL